MSVCHPIDGGAAVCADLKIIAVRTGESIRKITAEEKPGFAAVAENGVGIQAVDRLVCRAEREAPVDPAVRGGRAAEQKECVRKLVFDGQNALSARCDCTADLPCVARGDAAGQIGVRRGKVFARCGRPQCPQDVGCGQSAVAVRIAESVRRDRLHTHRTAARRCVPPDKAVPRLR